MLELNLPQYETKLKQIDSVRYIWDRIRKKYLVLTPEEWVRQHFVNYIIEYKDYPSSLITNEIEIKLHNQKRRCDTVVYNKKLEAICLVEYKAPNITITQDVFDQIVRYNMVLHVKYLIVSNGIVHYCCIIDYATNKISFLSQIPSYTDLEN